MNPGSGDGKQIESHLSFDIKQLLPAVNCLNPLLKPYNKFF